MSNGQDLANLQEFCRRNKMKIDIIMKTLKLAGFDDRVIDFVSDGLWTKYQAIIGLSLKDWGKK